MSQPEKQESQTVAPHSDTSDSNSAADAALESVAAENVAARQSAPNDWTIQLARLEADLREANDRVLRTQAELENFRKRSRREMDDERRYASLPLIRDLLNVMDNLERATQAAEKSAESGVSVGPGGAGLLEGVKMVAAQFLIYLEQYGCKRIPAVGLPFDPHQHEAVAQEPSTEHAVGLVTRITRQGYQLHDRVVRPAQVLVSLGPPTSPPPESQPPVASPGA